MARVLASPSQPAAFTVGFVNSPSGTEADNRLTDIRVLKQRIRAAIAATVVMAALSMWKVFDEIHRIGIELVLGSFVFFWAGALVNRRASATFRRRSIDGPALLSVIAGALYGYSLALGLGWIFFPRFIPLRWLDESLSIRLYFKLSSIFVLLGLTLLLGKILKQDHRS